MKLNSLSKPHAIHRREGGFMLCDTLGHRILLIDDDLNLHSEIACGSQWLQEAIFTSASTYFTLENVHIDQKPESGLNNRLSEIDGTGTELASLEVTLCASEPRGDSQCPIACRCNPPRRRPSSLPTARRVNLGLAWRVVR